MIRPEDEVEDLHVCNASLGICELGGRPSIGGMLWASLLRLASELSRRDGVKRNLNVGKPETESR